MADIPFTDFGISGIKQKALITASGSWVVPSGVFSVFVLATSGGGAGAGSTTTGNFKFGGSGGEAGSTGAVEVKVVPGQTLSIVIGAGGVAVSGLDGNIGGDTTVRVGNYPILAVKGGLGGIIQSSATVTESAKVYSHMECVKIAGGGNVGGAVASGASTANGKSPKLFLFNGSTDSVAIPGMLVAAAQGGATNLYPGGAGGSSVYGPGGRGGAGSEASVASDGETPTSTNYGAAGGGASGTSGTSRLGGNGIQGSVEIYF